MKKLLVFAAILSLSSYAQKLEPVAPEARYFCGDEWASLIFDLSNLNGPKAWVAGSIDDVSEQLDMGTVIALPISIKYAVEGKCQDCYDLEIEIDGDRAVAKMSRSSNGRVSLLAIFSDKSDLPVIPSSRVVGCLTKN